MQVTKIKCKVQGRYRNVTLLKVYLSRATKDIGYVDVRVNLEEQISGMDEVYKFLPIKCVRKSDLKLVKNFYDQQLILRKRLIESNSG